MTTPADFLREPELKPKADTVPTLYFHLPPLTPDDIVNNVFHDKGGWKTLQQASNETAEAERLRKLDEKFGMNVIPEPEFDPL